MDLRVSLVLVLVCLSSLAFGAPKHWAVLVAGSNGYFNYRHQANICHAYQILRRNGIPDERIIVMMYDDIAHNTNNPTPGVVVNEPNGNDVYANVPKDYVGRNVTPEVFINVLLGNQTYLQDKGSGKFLDSGPDDHVFVNFADHGAPGLVAFPNGELYSRQLIQTIEIMRTMKKFHKMVFYVEACESGSMFEGLLANDLNVFATTAANGDESSYACYWDDERQTYLGDVYSVRWMEDSDREQIYHETLTDQYHLVKAETNTSHVRQFGDHEIGDHYYVGEFVGMLRLDGVRTQPSTLKQSNSPVRLRPITDAVPSPDVPLFTLQKRLAAANTAQEKAKLMDELRQLQKNRALLDATVETIVKRVSLLTNDALLAVAGNAVVAEKGKKKKVLPIRNYACFERIVPHFSRVCAPFSHNDYALRKVQAFVDLCEKGAPTEAVFEAISGVCAGGEPMVGIH